MSIRVAVWLCVAMWLTGGVIAAAESHAPEYRQQPSDALFKPRDGLGNVLAKLRQGGKVKIAYLGGSITAARGWRVQSLEWFRQEFPTAEIEEVNACLGGTGSDLGVWDTENGYGPRSNTRKYWLPNHEGFAPLDMARTLAVAFACERFKGVEKTFYYHGWHYRLTEPAVLMNFHDVNSQLTPLTVTLPVAIQQLYGLQPGTASRQGLATVLQFASPAAEEPRRSVWMVWTERTPQSVEIRVPARARVSAVQVFGRPFAVQVDGDKATFQASPWPVYVTAQ